MDKQASKVAVGIISIVFILIFVWFWSQTLWDLNHFKPSGTQTTFDISSPQATILSFLATTLATGTAAVLGISIAQGPGGGEPPTTLKDKLVWSGKAVSSSSVLWIGVFCYLGIGVWVLAMWYYRSEASPDVVNSFGASVLGWMAGSMASIFKAATP